MIELKACPFCGSRASLGIVTNGGEANPDFGGHFVQCANVNCHGCMGLRFGCGDDPRPALIAAWNTRTSDLAAENARLREAAQFLCDRLSELEWCDWDDHQRAYFGHVDPALARLKLALGATTAERAKADQA